MHTLTLDATASGARAIGPWLLEVLDAIGDERRSEVVGGIELAVHELAMNSIDHASSPDGAVFLKASLHHDALEIHLSDRGEPFVADDVVSPDPARPQVRGYGLMIIEQLARSVHYERRDDVNVWTAIFAIEPLKKGAARDDRNG